MGQTKRYSGKTYRLYKSGATYGAYGLSRKEAGEIAQKLRKKGWSTRLEFNIWGNTNIWIRRK